MASCRIVNADVADAVGRLSTLSESYASAGEALISGLAGAISGMQGESKDALEEFISKVVKPFVTDQLPASVKGMSDLLEGNRTNFVSVDAEIAKSIRDASN